MDDRRLNPVAEADAGLQENGFSEESSFVTAPLPGSDTTVKLLAIADLGFCEEDGSMTWPGNYPNAVAVEPVGSDKEIISEVLLCP